MGNCASGPAREDVLNDLSLGKHEHLHRRTGDIYSEYEQKNRLGDGVEGSVWLAVKKEGGKQYYAVKTVNKSEKSALLDDVVHELEMLNILERHPGIVWVEEVWEDKSKIHVVQEFCQGGTLLEYMERQKETLTPSRVAEITRQLVDAVAHCHARGVLHRDIKEENVMFSDSSPTAHVKLIDFGNSRFLQRGKTTEGYAGTSFNAAPEVERGEKYDHKADIFSVGVLAYLMISGSYPFGYSEQGYNNLKEGRYYKCNIPPFTEASSMFIAATLTKEPRKRLSAAKCRKHAYLALETDHAESANAIKKRYEALEQTMSAQKKRLELQERLVTRLSPKSAEEQEDLLDNLVGLKAWMLDFQAETKSVDAMKALAASAQMSKSLSKLAGDGSANDPELAAPTITTIENFYIDLKSNGFDMLADNVKEAMHDCMEETINLDEVLRDLQQALETAESERDRVQRAQNELAV